MGANRMSTTMNAEPTAVEQPTPALLALMNRLSDVRGRLQEQANRTQTIASKLSGSNIQAPILPTMDEPSCYIKAFDREVDLLVTVLETLYPANNDLENII